MYATALDWPEDGKLTIETPAQGRTEYPKPIGQIELPGNTEPLPFSPQGERARRNPPEDETE